MEQTMETKGIRLVLEVTAAALKGRLRPPKPVSQNSPSTSFQAVKAAECLVQQPPAQPDAGCWATPETEGRREGRQGSAQPHALAQVPRRVGLAAGGGSRSAPLASHSQLGAGPTPGAGASHGILQSLLALGFGLGKDRKSVV